MTRGRWARVAVLLAAPIWGCLARQGGKGPGDPADGVVVAWLGHSGFTVLDGAGRLVLVDPFDDTVGFDLPALRPDAVLVTHEHFDHDAAQRFGRSPVLRSTGTHTLAGVEFTGISADHDAEGGRRNGTTRIYLWRQGGIRFAHLGDIGQSALRPDQAAALAGVDVLFVPVGGKTTVDAAGAKALADALRPRVVVPMHYGHSRVRFFGFDPLEPFLKLFKNIVEPTDPAFRLRAAELPAETTVYAPAAPR